jgi:hypothetical protein
MRLYTAGSNLSISSSEACERLEGQWADGRVSYSFPLPYLQLTHPPITPTSPETALSLTSDSNQIISFSALLTRSQPFLMP